MVEIEGFDGMLKNLGGDDVWVLRLSLDFVSIVDER